jgi:phosphoribosylformylglycinamidine cyclo-ligase
MERTFNMGVGMVAVIDPAAADDLIGLLADRGVPAWKIGTVGEQGGPVRAILRGEHP